MNWQNICCRAWHAHAHVIPRNDNLFLWKLAGNSACSKLTIDGLVQFCFSTIWRPPNLLAETNGGKKRFIASFFWLYMVICSMPRNAWIQSSIEMLLDVSWAFPIIYSEVTLYYFYHANILLHKYQPDHDYDQKLTNCLQRHTIYMSLVMTKCVFGSLRPGKTQTGLRSHRS